MRLWRARLPTRQDVAKNPPEDQTLYFGMTSANYPIGPLDGVRYVLSHMENPRNFIGDWPLDTRGRHITSSPLHWVPFHLSSGPMNDSCARQSGSQALKLFHTLSLPMRW